MYFEIKSCIYQFLTMKNGFTGRFHLYIAGLGQFPGVFFMEKLKKHDFHEIREVATWETACQKHIIFTYISITVEFKRLESIATTV